MIYAIVMSGGRGTRLKVPIEKPLFKLCNKPLIKYVLDNLSASKYVDEIFIATSPNTPKTKEYIEQLEGNYFILDTPGDNYVDDLSFILDSFENDDDILLFINADLPLVSSEIIDYTLERYHDCSKEALSVMVPVDTFKNLNLEYKYNFDGLVPSGLNIVKSDNKVQSEFLLIIDKGELALNINTLSDASIALKFLALSKTCVKKNF